MYIPQSGLVVEYALYYELVTDQERLLEFSFEIFILSFAKTELFVKVKKQRLGMNLYEILK